MQAASEAYKKSMKQGLREQSHIKVTIGLINQEAQESAYATPDGAHAYYSDLIKPFNNYEVEKLYATCEQDYTTTDGTMLFLPRSRTSGLINAGIVSKELLGLIEIKFPISFDIKGLTIDFGKAFPVDFEIKTNNYTELVVDNTRSNFITESIFYNTEFIRIIPSKMINEAGRLRIHKIIMGTGIYFDSKDIISVNKREYVSPIAKELPAIDFTLNVDNKDHIYDVENSSSSINFLEPGQKVEIAYGYETTENNIEWMPGATLYMKEWDADDTEMKFTATDKLVNMKDNYYNGQYYENGITLYDLSLDVFKDAGVDIRDYRVDSYLKKVTICNPIPVLTHKEALQLIANAGRCVLYQDRQGLICIKASFVPRMTATSSNATRYSRVIDILKNTAKAEYALPTQNYTTTTGSQYFLPRSNNYLNTGYISEAVANENGYFTLNPIVSIVLEASYNCFSLKLSFGGNPPLKVIIHSFKNNQLIESYVLTEILLDTLVFHEFIEFDHIDIEFLQGTPNNRILLNYVEFGDVSDYKLEYRADLKESPRGIRTQKIKELQIIRTIYNKNSDTAKELAKEVVEVTSTQKQFTFYLAEPAHDLSCNNGTIIAKSAYFATVEITKLGKIEIILSGKTYTVSTARQIKQLNPTGAIEVWSNPLVSSINHADEMADWIGDYLAADREYELSYRGEPRIDGNDLIYLENKYIDNLLIRVYEHNLDLNGGALSGMIKARREMGVD